MKNPSAQHLADHLRQVFFGGNWTVSNFKDQLSDITLQEATTVTGFSNTIAVLTYHIGYFLYAVNPVFEGAKLDAHDKFSFDHPPLKEESDWREMVLGILDQASILETNLRGIYDEALWEDFVDPKYKSLYRNIAGIIEHTHYHLGQISLIKNNIRK